MSDTEKKVAWGISLVVVFIGLALIPWVMHVATPSFSSDGKEWADFGTYVGGVLSPILAGISFVGLLVTIIQQSQAAEKQKRNADSENYFKHAVQSLERAYKTIAPNHNDITPLRSRLAWLTCARLLLSAKDASQRIAPESTGLISLYEGEEEYWRHKFYELLKPTHPKGVGYRAEFFCANVATAEEEIAEESIRVIYEFTDWPKERKDPLRAIPHYTSAELDDFGIGMLGVETYIRAKPRFREANK